MKLKSLTFLLLFSLTSFYFINPWKIILLNNGLNWIPQLLLTLGIVIPLHHLFLKVKNYYHQFIIRITSVILIISCVLRFSLLQFLGHPMQSEYAVLYANPENDYEKIKIIHNHLSTHNFNETKHIITFPNFGVKLEKDFNKNNLNGIWYVYKNNPFHRTEGTFLFDNGKTINN